MGRDEKKPRRSLHGLWSDVDDRQNSVIESPLDGEIRQLVANLGKELLTGREIVAAGLTGGWEGKGITDSVEWLANQRRKRRDKFD